MTATVVTQSKVRPYLTTVVGPTSHSPPPMEVPKRMAPGPITLKMFSTSQAGAGGKSASSQAGNSPAETVAGGSDFNVFDITGSPGSPVSS